MIIKMSAHRVKSTNSVGKDSERRRQTTEERDQQ